MPVRRAVHTARAFNAKYALCRMVLSSADITGCLRAGARERAGANSEGLDPGGPHSALHTRREFGSCGFEVDL